ncbi:MAG: Rieske 2Fe-2S domain-containing protein, partial [Actinophytocola sp.]|nr:Rieske 2Fe-2S domain-containing protein [Actinophytocola sp.]
MELEQVFARSWLFVGHESQIPNPGDFTQTTMGEDPVIVTRAQDMSIQVLLNSCRHRGAKVCLTDRGNARVFQCKYHNWAYANSGELVGVPLFDSAYFRELDKSQWGLIPVPRVEVAHGLVFGCWDAQAPSLREYLGEMDHYLELMLDRTPGGVEVVAGVQRSTSP